MALLLPRFRRLPERFHFGEGCRFEGLTPRRKSLFDDLETTHEFGVGRAQSCLRIDLQMGTCVLIG